MGTTAQVKLKKIQQRWTPNQLQRIYLEGTTLISL